MKQALRYKFVSQMFISFVFGGFMLKRLILFFLCSLLLYSFFSCGNIDTNKRIPQPEPQQPNVRPEQPDLNSVPVEFFNASSFKVDIFRNFNPSSSDKSTPPIATVPQGTSVTVKLPPSSDQLIGDVFYIHYYVQLADAFSSGTGNALYVQAERDISNIAFVLEAGKSYTKKIAQPEKNQLKFINGYIKVQNTGYKSFQVMNGSSFIKKLGTEEPNLQGGKFGFYEFEIPAIEKNIEVTSLKFFVTDDGKYLNVPQFLMERGKLYNFQCNSSYVTGPSVKEIRY